MVVSVQTILSLVQRRIDASKAHAQAGRKLISKGLGLSTFRLLQWRHIVWNDLRLASALLECPTLPFSPRNASAKLPPSLIDQAHLLTLATEQLIPTSSRLSTKAAYDLFLGLHQIGLALGMPLVEEKHLLAIENVYYGNVYQLCLMTAEIRTIDLRSFSASDSLVLSAASFIWACTPSFVSLKGVFPSVMDILQSQLLRQLYERLVHEVDLMGSWQKQARLESLLWVLSVGTIAANTISSGDNPWMPQPVHPWFVKKLREIAVELHVRSVDDLERALRLFPWADPFSSEDCRMMWARLALSNVEDAPAFNVSGTSESVISVPCDISYGTMIPSVL